MANEERQKANEPGDTEFSEELEVIVMGVNRVHRHCFAPELASVVEISSVPGPDDWTQFPLIHSGPPKVDPDVFVIDDLPGSRCQIIAFMNDEECDKGSEQGKDN